MRTHLLRRGLQADRHRSHRLQDTGMSSVTLTWYFPWLLVVVVVGGPAMLRNIVASSCALKSKMIPESHDILSSIQRPNNEDAATFITLESVAPATEIQWKEYRPEENVDFSAERRGWSINVKKSRSRTPRYVTFPSTNGTHHDNRHKMFPGVE